MKIKIFKKVKKIKGVIFDLDGTLLKTEHFNWQAWATVLKHYKISLSKKDYFKYSGKQGDIIESELIKYYGLNAKKGFLLKQKDRLIIGLFKLKPPKFIPYARESIKFFINRKIKLAIATGGPRNEVILKLKRVKLYSLFPVVSGNEVVKGKPYPDIYLLAVKKLRLKPESCIAFEDTQYGVESAKSAGLACLAIPNEFSQNQDFSRADGVFKSLRESVKWVKEKYNL